VQVVTSKMLAEKLSAYLRHKLSLSDLVDWAEDIMKEGDFEEKNYETLRNIVSQLGVADVKAFGLTWEDCERFLNQLGYKVKVEVVSG